MTGDELRMARLAAGLTQQELGDKLRVSLRTVGNWERSTGRLPGARERQIRDAIGVVGGNTNPLKTVSDLALLAELGERLDRAARERSESHDRGQQKIVNGRDEDGLVVMPPPVEPLPPRARGQRPARRGQGIDRSR